MFHVSFAFSSAVTSSALLPRARVAALVANFILVAALLGAPSSAQSAPASPVLLRGDVPAGTLSVEVYAEPYEAHATSGVMHSWRVPADATLSGGRFTARVNPVDIQSRVVRPGGLVDFEVVARGVGGQTSTWITARMARIGSSVGWVDPVATSALTAGKAYALDLAAGGTVRVPSVEDNHAARSTRSSGNSGGVELEAFPPIEETGGPAASLAGKGVESAQGANAKSAARCRYEYWEYTSTYKTKPATLSTGYPVGADKSHMVVSSSQGANYGMAAGSTGAYAGFHLSGSRFVKSGWGFTWAKSGSQRSYRKGIRYQLMRKRCYGTGTLSSPRFIWRPVSETGGTSTNTGLSRPGWSTCARVDKGTWRRDRSSGKSYAYGAAVKMKSVIGIDLSIKRNYSSSQKLVYTLKKKRRLCGNGAYPSSAGKIIDRVR